MRAARTYMTSCKPSDATTHSICASFAEMIALDRSETQAIGKLAAEESDGKLHLRAVRANGSLDVERKEVESQAGEFKKLWGLKPVLHEH